MYLESLRARAVPVVALMVCFCLRVGFSQSTSGSISGTVVDAQQASVAGAKVTATEQERKFSFTTTSTEAGRFVFAQTPPGIYTVTVESGGFKKLDRNDVTVNANDRIDVGNLALEVGAVSESVEVSAEAGMVQTENAERSQALVAKQMQNIAINGRSDLAMVSLLPGVVSTGDFKISGSSGGASGVETISANGVRMNANQLTLNGVSAVDSGANGGPIVSVSLDATQEFKVITGTYAAEYGKAAGSHIAVVTKSGGSSLHGSGYWFHRQEDLNANPWFNNRQGLARPLYRFQDPGYNLGGPVYIPKVFEKTKDKLFFLWSQEFQHQLIPHALTNATVPTALERQGDFSQSVDSSGNPLARITDPLSGLPFPNRVIPPSRLYQPGLALLKIFPLPNAPGNKGFNYQSDVSTDYPRREDLARIDYNISYKSHMFGHWIHNSNGFTSPYGSFVIAPNTPITEVKYNTPGHSVALGDTYIFSPTTTNEFNFGYTHNFSAINEVGNALTRAASGVNLPLLYPNAVQDDYLPNVSFGGTRIASGPVLGTQSAPFYCYVSILDWTDNVSKVTGNHIIKTGLFVQRSRKNQTSYNSNNGVYNFDDNASNPFDTGFAFANAAVGVYNSFSQSSSYLTGEYRYTNFEVYLQDTWKVTRRLTLDYGLRGSYYQPQYDASLQTATFLPNTFSFANAVRLFRPGLNSSGQRIAVDPVTGLTEPGVDIGVIVPGTGSFTNGVAQPGKGINKYLMDSRGLQWGPRLGIAWDVTGKQNIVLRTGGGIFYDRIPGNRVFDMIRNPPLSVTPTLNYGFIQDINSSSALLAPATLYAFDPNGKVPTVYSLSFGVQTKLPYQIVLDTSYVGSMSRHLQDNRNLNPVPYGAAFLPQNQDPTLAPNATRGANALPANFLRPYSGYSNILLYESSATSNYNSLQVVANRRLAKGLFFGMAYTWSHALTTASSDTSYFRIDQYSREALYANASFDRRQNFKLNYIYEFPRMVHSNSLLHKVVDGWQISGVTSFTTGIPLTPTFNISGVGSNTSTGTSGNVLLTGSYTEAARIVVVGNPNTGSSNPYDRLNPAAFAAPAPGSIGLESALNFAHSPGINNWDVSVQKTFDVRERLHFQFRVDGFNAFNHPQFNALNSTLNFSSLTNPVPTNLPYNSSGALVNVNGFGTVSGTRDPRFLQTVIRVTF